MSNPRNFDTRDSREFVRRRRVCECGFAGTTVETWATGGRGRPMVPELHDVVPVAALRQVHALLAQLIAEREG